jgi:hypothetical protein
VKTMRGSDVKHWVEPLLGLVQLGLGRVVIGLLEGLLVGPEELPIRKRIRAVLQSLKASKVGRLGLLWCPLLLGDLVGSAG